MRRSLAVAVLLIAAQSAAAAALQFGNEFPLTNTRYTPQKGFPKLVSNGQELFLFWWDAYHVRVTRIGDGERVGGRVVLETWSGSDFSVVWTGTHFLVVGADAGKFVGQLLDADANRVGSPVPITASGTQPRLARNGESILLVWLAQRGELQSIMLTLEGRPVPGSFAVLDQGYDNLSTVVAVCACGSGFVAASTLGVKATISTLDARGRQLSKQVVSHEQTFNIALASHAEECIAVWSEWMQPGMTIYGATLTASGIASPPVAIEENIRQLYAIAASMTRTADSWLIAFSTDTGVRLSYVSPDLHRNHGFERIENAGYPSLATLGDRTVAAVRGADGAVRLIDLPLAGSIAPAEMAPASLAAGEQTLKATASSADATLFVWSETGNGTTSVVAGVRRRDGRWSERALGTFPSAPLVAAASNGREFIVTAGDSAFHLDDEGRIARTTTSLPLAVTGIAWNGTAYALIGFNSGLAAALLDPTGGVGSAVSLETDFTPLLPASIATDGTSYFAVWPAMDFCGIPVCVNIPDRVVGSRLGPDFKRMGEEIVLGSGAHAGVTWDGTDYVVVSMHDGLESVRITPSGTMHQRIVIAADAAPISGVTVTRIGNAAGIGWQEIFGQRRRRGAYLTRGGAQLFTFDSTTRALSPPHMLALPDGAVAFVSSSLQPLPPHHGSNRVIMSIASPLSTRPPSAPRALARIENGRARIEWTPTDEIIAGYRVEYRVGNGAWNELGRWFDPEERSVVLDWTLRSGVKYSFRVRAFADGGASDYSNVASVNTSRRRAVH